jgi:uncharacterized delta-60 repeat protein
MFLSSWLRNRTTRKHSSARRQRPAAVSARLELLEDRCLLSAGQLDPTFGNGGLVTTDVPGATNDYAADITVTQPDGKIVVVGTISVVNTGLAVARYNADGSLDTTFGSGGKAVFLPGSGLEMSPSAVTVDSLGHILFAALDLSTVHFGRVLRLNGDGSLDTTFGNGGRATLPIYAGLVKVDSANRIIVVGGGSVARLKADGSLDAGFGSGGIANIGFIGDYPDRVNSVAVDATNRIIVAGVTFSTSGGTGYDFAVARLNADGTPDAGFGSGGETTIDFSGPYSYAYDEAVGVAADARGRIVVGGISSQYGVGRSFAVARLNAADGSLDTSFGTAGESTIRFGNDSFVTASRMAVDALGRIAVVGLGSGNSVAVGLFKPDGCPDVDFGIAGKVTSNVAGFSFAGAAFDTAGHLVLAGTTYSSTTGYDFALARYVPHDPVVEAGSATLAADLQAAVTAVRTTTPPSITPRVVIHVASQAQMTAAVAALAGLPDSSTGAVVEVLLDVDAGGFQLGSVSVPAGLKLLLDGDGGACGAGTFASAAGPVLTLLSGEVDIRDGATLTGAPKAPALVVQGGRLGLEDSTINAAATGSLIRLTGPNDVLALRDTFELGGWPLYDNFQIEDLIDHSLDGLGGGTVFWVPNNVFVTANSGSVQRGVNVVLSGGTVNVQAGVKGTDYVGSKLLTLAYDNGLTITQQADTLDATKRELLVSDVYTTGSNSIKFVAGTNPGEVQLNVNNLLQATFLPTGRLVEYAGYGDDVQVDSALTLSAWLYGSGNDRLKGGGGNNVLIGSGGGDLLVGGSARDLIIGTGADRLVSNGGQDILIAGSTSYNSNEVALAAILAEWTSSDSLATRIADLTGNTASPYFTGGLNGNYFLINSGPNQTVFNDYSADTITAGSGPDMIFASSSDKVTGLTAADVAFILS